MKILFHDWRRLAFLPSFCHSCACEMSLGWGHLITWIDPSVGHLNGILARVGANLSNNFQKSQMPGGLPGGDIEASIWLIHKLPIMFLRKAKTLFCTKFLKPYRTVVTLRPWPKKKKINFGTPTRRLPFHCFGTSNMAAVTSTAETEKIWGRGCAIRDVAHFAKKRKSNLCLKTYQEQQKYN